jgi:hypothetical protein
MRLRSDMFVSALIRTVFSRGGYAVVERKGMDQAGAIFIRQRFRNGLETLFGPAPQSLVDEEGAMDRRFEMRLDHAEPEAVAALMEREAKWDPDLWLVELEVESVDGLFIVQEP